MSAKVATTQWSQVIAARDGSGTDSRQALESLCQTYWLPLYAYARSLGHTADEASDLTQGFFAYWLEKEILQSVDPSAGRFRSFLFAAIKNFISRQDRMERTLKRGGGTTTISLDFEAGEERYLAHPVEKMTPQDIFEHRWAVTVLDRAMDRLEADSDTAEDGNQFQLLKQYLTSEGPEQSYRQVATTLGMSEGAVKVAVHRLRKRFGKYLRLEIAETVVDPADVDDEVRHLLQVVRR